MIPTTNIVNKQYMDGSVQRKHPYYEIPSIRKPTKLEWSEWRDFIWRNFLRGIYEVTPPLQWRRHECQGYQEARNEIQQLSTCNWNATLTTICSTLPTVWKQILGNIKCPSDDGAELAKQISLGQSIGASDGSLITMNDEEYGGHAYSLNVWGSDEHSIIGYAPTPRSTEMTSLTTELYGLIATTLVVYIVCQKYNITTKVTVPLTSDNEQGVKMGQEWKVPINISETTVHEYDLWRLLWQLTLEVNIKIQFQWVKSHQDTNKAGDKVFGPFTRPVQLNISMDELAKQATNAAKVTMTIQPVYSTTALGFFAPNGLLVDNIRDYFQYAITAPPMIEYLMKKNNWTIEKIQWINWKDIESALNTYKPFYRTRMAQLMHDWQHTGDRIQLMNEGKADCPTQCGQCETKLHYLQCPDNSVRVERRKALTLFTHQLKSHLLQTSAIFLVRGSAIQKKKHYLA